MRSCTVRRQMSVAAKTKAQAGSSIVMHISGHIWYLFVSIFTLPETFWKVTAVRRSLKYRIEHNIRHKQVWLGGNQRRISAQRGNSWKKTNPCTVQQAWVIVYLGMFEECGHCTLSSLTEKLNAALHRKGRLGKKIGVSLHSECGSWKKTTRGPENDSVSLQPISHLDYILPSRLGGCFCGSWN